MERGAAVGDDSSVGVGTAGSGSAGAAGAGWPVDSGCVPVAGCVAVAVLAVTVTVAAGSSPPGWQPLPRKNANAMNTATETAAAMIIFSSLGRSANLCFLPDYSSTGEISSPQGCIEIEEAEVPSLYSV